MKVEIKNITPENLESILHLRVATEQASYVETPAQCLADASECDSYVPVGLYADNILVGFAMYGLFLNECEGSKVWLDRFLIDEHFQGKGLGQIMLRALIDHLRHIYHSQTIYLSLFENNQGALYLYQKFGFEFNGELDINGEKVMILQEKNE
ncbi:GNAT family N-acetyltransferase [Paenibacillus sp. KACC 21273]|uniref:GNAT family N-acetyltransferase n=1 Tax=Paenibacillus sp. KACC 21273 TaxID=3025665 RepID=UPI002366854A|nr:GNAT family N-acetyltransferase [Paenibacillus sp. KACC 21273]WDF51274.1 GNAT family N-acetyltransferase [Paenibacillus sp. KACC 21273]